MYYAEVMWWNDYDGENVTTCMFIAAGNYEEAVRYINQTFDDIASIKIEEPDPEEHHIVYIPKEVAQQVKDENLY